MSSTETKTEGKTDEMKGKAREAWGNVTGNEDQQAKGQKDQVKGHAKQAIGEVQNAWDKATDPD